MVLLACAALCLAIAALQLNCRANDDLTHLLLNATAFLCALFCLLAAPWWVQLLMLIALIAAPSCVLHPHSDRLASQRDSRPSCPTVCLGRWHCHSTNHSS